MEIRFNKVDNENSGVEVLRAKYIPYEAKYIYSFRLPLQISLYENAKLN